MITQEKSSQSRDEDLGVSGIGVQGLGSLRIPEVSLRFFQTNL